MEKENSYKEKGIGLLEVVLSIAVFLVGVGVVIHLFFNSYIISVNSFEKSQAYLLSKEGIEAVRSIRDGDIENITELVDGGVVLSGGKWMLRSSPTIIEEKFTRKINIEMIVEEERWEVVSEVTWKNARGGEEVFSLSEHLSTWKEPLLIEIPSEEEFIDEEEVEGDEEEKEKKEKEDEEEKEEKDE